MASGGGEPGAALPGPMSTRPETAWGCGVGTTVQAGETTAVKSVVTCSCRTYRPAGMVGTTVKDQATLAGAGSVSPPPPSVRAPVAKRGAAGSYLPPPVRSRAQRTTAEPPGLATSKW